MCLQVFPNQAELARHTEADHPTNASASYSLPVERYKPKRAPASSDTDRKKIPVKGRGPTWFVDSHNDSTTPRRKRGFMGISGSMDVTHDGHFIGLIGRSVLGDALEPSNTGREVGFISIKRSIPQSDAPAAVLVDLPTVLPYQAAIEEYPTSSPISSNQPTKEFPTRALRVWECQICHTNLLSKMALKSHISRHRDNPNGAQFPPLPPAGITSADADPTPTQCMPCNLGFPSRKDFDLHFHNSPIHTHKLHCSLCSLHFLTLGALVVHGVIAHGLELSCDQCTRRFATEALRAAHVRSAHPEPMTVPSPPESEPGSNRSAGTWAGLFASRKNRAAKPLRRQR